MIHRRKKAHKKIIISVNEINGSNNTSVNQTKILVVCLLLYFEYINHRIIERMNPNHPDNNNCEGDLERDAEGELIDV